MDFGESDDGDDDQLEFRVTHFFSWATISDWKKCQTWNTVQECNKSSRSNSLKLGSLENVMLRQRLFRRNSFTSTRPSSRTSLNTIIVSPPLTPNQYSDGDVDAWVGGKGDKGGDGGGKMIDYAEGELIVEYD